MQCFTWIFICLVQLNKFSRLALFFNSLLGIPHSSLSDSISGAYDSSYNFDFASLFSTAIPIYYSCMFIQIYFNVVCCSLSDITTIIKHKSSFNFYFAWLFLAFIHVNLLQLPILLIYFIAVCCYPFDSTTIIRHMRVYIILILPDACYLLTYCLLFTYYTAF